MNTAYVAARIKEVDEAIALVKKGLPADPKLQAYLAGYLCVMASGVYETAIETLFCEYAKKNGNPEICTFMRETMDKTFRNPDSGKIKEYLKRLDTGWAQKLDGLLQAGTHDCTGLDSIVNNKNQLAHGLLCSATVADVEKFHGQSVPVISAIEGLLGL